MLKIAVCDDEIYYQNIIREKVIGYLNEKGVEAEADCYDSGEDLLQQEEKIAEYQILFLDISMKELNGIETAKRIRKLAKNSYLVFVTAFLGYWMEGYKVEAIRYLLKEDKMFEESIEEAIDAILQKEKQQKICKFPFLEGEREIELQDIVYIESSLHKLEFHLIGAEQKILSLYERLDSIAPLFLENGFIRMHKSFLTNPFYIKKIRNYTAFLVTGEELPIPKAKYREVKNQFVRYEGEL